MTLAGVVLNGDVKPQLIRRVVPPIGEVVAAQWVRACGVLI
jgi:hypothetical protein